MDLLGGERRSVGGRPGRPRAAPAPTAGSVGPVSRATDPPSPAARPSVGLLGDRVFGPWFFGLAVSNSGNWLFNVTAAVVVFQLSGSALLVGLVSVAQFAPLALLSPAAGALTDRVDRRGLLLVAQGFAAFCATALAVPVLLLGVDGLPGAWPIVAAATGIGIGQAVSAPAMQALVPSLVDDADLESGIALTSLTFSLGRAAGPATSGVLLATLGPEIAFAANAVSFVVLLAALAVVRPRPRRSAVDRDASVRAGVAHVRRDRLTLLLLGGVAATGFAADPMITLAPSLTTVLDGGDTLTAVLVSAFGIAAAPAAAVSGRLQRRYGSLSVAGAGATTMAVGLTTAAVAQVAAVAVAGFALCGVGFVLALTGFTSVLQRRVPDEMRGRIMALWSVAFLGNRPIAALIDGRAADLFGPRWAMLVAIVVALGGVVLARRAREHHTVPPAS
ncbi:MFS transporter [Nitriliruptoraceae bacterium ZYF776]|nr:MFS transporter [Profundirhabdus halotolerans]